MALWNQTTPDENNEKPRIELTPAAAVAPVNATPPATAKETSSKDRRESVFGTGVSIEGKIEGDADVRIGGKFKGDIHIKGDLNIEKGAMLTAKIHAVNVTIGGALDGNVVASARWGEGTFPPTVQAFQPTSPPAPPSAAGCGCTRSRSTAGPPRCSTAGGSVRARSPTRRPSTPPMRATRSASRCSPPPSSAPPPRAARDFDMLRGDERHKQRFRISTHPLESHLVARRGSPARGSRRSPARRPGSAWARLPARGRARLGRLRAR